MHAAKFGFGFCESFRTDNPFPNFKFGRLRNGGFVAEPLPKRMLLKADIR
jgi:hypothetical protein